MLDKSLFTAMIKSTGNTGDCGCVPLTVVNKSTGTYYAYDIHGNVDTLLQHYRQGIMADHRYNQFKEIAYKYDLISGKVNEVHYQPGAVDQFYHRYEYDAENRITDVYTSDHKAYIGHKSLEEHEAFYEYYKHGPLARTVIGQQQVQGIDYAYTLQGWLKGVNSTALTPVYDMGGDGAVPPSGGAGGTRDAYSFNLNYFTGDYSPINTTVSLFPGFSGLFPTGYSYKPLYNGNISAMSVNIGKLNNPLLYNYQYDQLNRLVAMDAFTGLDTSNNTWNALTTDNSYQERVSYDANGNIQKYLRNGTVAGGTPLGMDSLTYKYNRDANGQLVNNQLNSVNDSVPAGNYPDDIDNQSANNYGYDAIGNLIRDNAGGIDTINWTVYGKISNITKTDGSTIAYTYDAAGNRISKTVTPTSGVATTTWYVRDASGNTMAVYTANGSDSLHQTEQDLYGSSRLGIFNRNVNADALLPTGTSAYLIGNYVVSYFARGNKNYELSNHLGNVLATVSDKKFGVDTNRDEIIDYYIADVVSANDYYPYGMLMPGRKYSIANTNYRYGFNGKELDKEMSATTTYDYGFRIYNPALGRFLSVDPLTKSFAYYSPYDFAGNTPIQAIDVDGKEPGKREALQTISKLHNGVTAMSTQFNIESGWAATFSSGMSVDPAGNVLMFSTRGGLAMLDDNINGGATNVGISLTKNLSFYNSHIQSLKDLLGTGRTTNAGTSWKDVVVAGYAVESDNGGHAIGSTISLGLGFAGLPNEVSSVKAKTTGIILTGAEYDMVYNQRKSTGVIGFAKYNDWNYEQAKENGVNNAPFQTISSGNVQLEYLPTGKKDQYKLQYKYSFSVVPNELYWSRQAEGTPVPQPLTTISYSFDTGVSITKDPNGNYISDKYESQQKANNK